jgi:hypothetical protein
MTSPSHLLFCGGCGLILARILLGSYEREKLGIKKAPEGWRSPKFPWLDE